jgi:hypothetical protein
MFLSHFDLVRVPMSGPGFLKKSSPTAEKGNHWVAARSTEVEAPRACFFNDEPNPNPKQTGRSSICHSHRGGSYRVSTLRKKPCVCVCVCVCFSVMPAPCACSACVRACVRACACVRARACVRACARTCTPRVFQYATRPGVMRRVRIAQFTCSVRRRTTLLLHVMRSPAPVSEATDLVAALPT